jgi:hypothetical protein
LFGESHFRSLRTSVSDAEVGAIVAEEAGKRRRWLENLVNTYGAKADKDAVDYVNPQLHPLEGDARHIVPKILDVQSVATGITPRGFFFAAPG